METELDRAHQQLLEAIDAARGAEAERAVAQARVRDLEHQHHMLKVERDELRREVERLGGGWSRLASRVVRRLCRIAPGAVLDRP
jgi:uncharacterized coiled-coil DUF342 family protein